MNGIDYRNYELSSTGRVREAIEWTQTYAYNATDLTSPRVLLIGDSICNGYHAKVREKLGDKVNVTFWATSKCVTDPDYLRELDFILDCRPYSIVTFNNGLHSLTSDRAEWTAAYRNAVRFIRAKLPKTLLSIVYCTPLKEADKTAVSRELNRVAQRIADGEHLPVVDLFSPLDGLDREEYWSDVFHFKDAGKDIQAEILKNHVLGRLGLADAAGSLCQQSSETGPDGALR